MTTIKMDKETFVSSVEKLIQMVDNYTESVTTSTAQFSSFQSDLLGDGYTKLFNKVDSELKNQKVLAAECIVLSESAKSFAEEISSAEWIMGEIKYDSGQHKQFQEELQKIGDGFDNLITELGNVKTSVSSNLKGEAATALETAIDDLTAKLTKAKTNWHTTNENAKKVEEIIKKADEDAKKIVDEQK